MANWLKMAEIHTSEQLLRLGWSQRRIARELGIHRTTVAEKAFALFVGKYSDKYTSADECVQMDREVLAFYDFPAQHWVHLRTTNPTESTLATVRLSTKSARRSGSRNASLTMVFELAQAAAKNWRRLTARTGSRSLPDQNPRSTTLDGISLHGASEGLEGGPVWPNCGGPA